MRALEFFIFVDFGGIVVYIPYTMLFRDTDRVKLLNAISYFADKIPQLSMEKLLKLLFFLDTKHLKQTGRTVTDLDYYALPNGPVPQYLYTELQAGNGEFNTYFSIQKMDRSYYITSTKKYDRDTFSPRQLDLMDELIDLYSLKLAQDMSEETHKHGSSWDITVKEKGMNAIIDLTLEIDENDPVDIEIARENFTMHREIKKNYMYG